MRPIDADALKESVENLFCEKCYEHDSAFCADCAIHYLIQYSDKLPTLDDPIPKGEWIEDGYNDIPCVCSHCGGEAHYISTFKQQFDYDWEENLVPTGYEEIKDYIRSEYCPHCGAKLGGGE